MNKQLTTWAVVITSLACIAPVRAHHSISMFDISAPIWVKGTVVNYEAVNPHAMIALEERREDGRIQRWTVEGPTLARLDRMGVDENVLKTGDVIEVCGFALKKGVSTRRASSDTAGSSLRFVHGHMLLMPNGQMRPWGPYGKLDNCVRSGDQRQSWADFLSTDPIARDLWCAKHRTSVPTRASALVDEIDRLMVDPCD